MFSRDRFRIKKFAAARRLQRLMAQLHYDLDEAARDPRKKVAWCSSMGPVELLRAMGFEVFFPENHAASIGTRKQAGKAMAAARSQGFGSKACSYLTSDIGSFLLGSSPLAAVYTGNEGRDPIGGVPRPDVLVYGTNQCREVCDWFRWYAQRLDVPCFGLEFFHHTGAVDEEHVKAVAVRMEILAQELASFAPRKLDKEALREVVDLSKRTSNAWSRVLDFGRHRPSPIAFHDALIHMAPAVLARGTPAALEYYEELIDEISGRVDAGTAAVPGEEVRLYWEGMPVWGRFLEHAVFFGERRANIVASTYCNSWVFDALDPDDPLASMARAYSELFINRDDVYKERAVADACRRFGVDGIVFHDSQTCPRNSNVRFGMPGRVEAATGLPTVVIEADTNDLSFCADEVNALRLEALFEQVKAAR